MIIHFTEIGSLCIRVWFNAANNLAVDQLLEVSIIDKSVPSIFWAEFNLVSWYPQLGEILVPATKIQSAIVPAEISENTHPPSLQFTTGKHW